MGYAMRRARQVRETAARPYEAAPTLSPDAREELAEEIRSLAAHLHAGAPRARWTRESDIPDEILFRALEATAPG